MGQNRVARQAVGQAGHGQVVGRRARCDRKTGGGGYVVCKADRAAGGAVLDGDVDCPNRPGKCCATSPGEREISDLCAHRTTHTDRTAGVEGEVAGADPDRAADGADCDGTAGAGAQGQVLAVGQAQTCKGDGTGRGSAHAGRIGHRGAHTTKVDHAGAGGGDGAGDAFGRRCGRCHAACKSSAVTGLIAHPHLPAVGQAGHAAHAVAGPEQGQVITARTQGRAEIAGDVGAAGEGDGTQLGGVDDVNLVLGDRAIETQAARLANAQRAGAAEGLVHGQGRGALPPVEHQGGIVGHSAGADQAGGTTITDLQHARTHRGGAAVGVVARIDLRARTQLAQAGGAKSVADHP